MRSVPLPPDLQARFEVVDLLGQGGMGQVWLARERTSGREVALKLLNQRVTPERRERMLREGRLAGKVVHPGVVRVHDAGTAGDFPWVCYEHVAGARSLAELLPSASHATRMGWILELARAVGAAHAGGVIHRDLKPDNVLIDTHGRVKVIDFGLASTAGLERLTVTGALVGTPHYMAPEQISGRGSREPDARTDVWALGVLLYEALTGELPFQGDSLPALAVAITAGRAPTPSTASTEASPTLDAVCATALQVDPERRYANARAFAWALEAALNDGGTAPKRWRLAVVAVLLASLIGVAAWAGLRGTPTESAQAVSPALLLDPVPPVTLHPQLLLQGRIEGPPCELHVEVGRESRRVPVRPDGSFRTRVSLFEGPNQVRLLATADDGATAQASCSVARLAYPEWFTRIARAQRPSIPLPEGVEPTQSAGEYRGVDGSILVYVPGANQVTLGVPTESFDGKDFMHPLAERTVDVAPFFLGKHEVNWDQLRRFWADDRPHDPFPSNGIFTVGNEGEGTLQRLATPYVARGKDPAFRVTVRAAQAYCAWAGGRLPSDYEWEFAAGAGESRDHPWGPWEQGRANLEGAVDGFLTLAPADAFPDGASPFGALNMAGNLEEFVLSEDGSDPDAFATRGGSWRHYPIGARVTSRGEFPPVAVALKANADTLGFRLCIPVRR